MFLVLTKTISYSGVDLNYDDSDTPHIICTNDGLVFSPVYEDVMELVTAKASLLHYPMEPTEWRGVNVNWTRQAPTTPTSFEAVISLTGITGMGERRLVAEYYTTTCDTTSTTEDIFFDLKNCEGLFPLRLTSTAAAAGKVAFNLPLRYKHYSSAVLYTNLSTTDAPDVESDNLTTIVFSTPPGWVDGNSANLILTRDGMVGQYSPTMNMSATNTFDVGSSGLGRFEALEVGFEITCTPDYIFQINEITFDVGVM